MKPALRHRRSLHQGLHSPMLSQPLTRTKLSKQIGSLMSSGKKDEAQSIKAQSQKILFDVDEFKKVIQADMSSLDLRVEDLIKFVNRLSDTIYTFARYLESEIILMNFEEMGKEKL